MTACHSHVLCADPLSDTGPPIAVPSAVEIPRVHATRHPDTASACIVVVLAGHRCRQGLVIGVATQMLSRCHSGHRVHAVAPRYREPVTAHICTCLSLHVVTISRLHRALASAAWGKVTLIARVLGVSLISRVRSRAGSRTRCAIRRAANPPSLETPTCRHGRVCRMTCGGAC